MLKRAVPGSVTRPWDTKNLPPVQPKGKCGPMKVLQVSNFYPPYWVGGYEQIAEWVATGLREHGHQVDVLTGRGPAFEDRAEIHGELDLDLGELAKSYFTKGMSFSDGMRGNLMRHVFSPPNFGACRRIIREIQPDLVSFWNPACISFSPLLAARLEGVPAVVHLSDTVANVFRNPHPPIADAKLRRLGRWAAISAPAGPSRSFRGPKQLSEAKVRQSGRASGRSHHGSALACRAHRERDRSPGARDTRASQVAVCRHLDSEKGPDVLLDAFAGAHRQRPDLTLTLVGEGPWATWPVWYKGQGLPVRFAGRLDRAAVTRAYAEHDVLVFPSVWDEPYAVVPPEAMAMGLAVIGTTAGGTPEAIIHEQTGLLVPPRDAGALREAILRLCQEPDLASRLARKGQEWPAARSRLRHSCSKSWTCIRKKCGRSPRDEDCISLRTVPSGQQRGEDPQLSPHASFGGAPRGASARSLMGAWGACRRLRQAVRILPPVPIRLFAVEAAALGAPAQRAARRRLRVLRQAQHTRTVPRVVRHHAPELIVVDEAVVAPYAWPHQNIPAILARQKVDYRYYWDVCRCTPMGPAKL